MVRLAAFRDRDVGELLNERLRLLDVEADGVEQVCRWFRRRSEALELARIERFMDAELAVEEAAALESALASLRVL
ncbi:MAG: hypothetical protein H6747_10750 [Deltaproteobacteria bacterium]|nr:hypothetical protein [Deltaproteobacteria bacterium]